MKQPYRHFDLPTIHLDPHKAHHIPRRATNQSEVERRKTLPKGTLLAEEQTRGIAVAARLLWHLSEQEDIAFVRPIIAAAGINTAWYDFAAQSPVMRRRLLLPRLDESPDAQDADALLAGASEDRRAHV